MAIAEEENIFNAARQIQSAEPRRLYLEQACGGNVDLRTRIEAFLRVHDENKSFLKNPGDGTRPAPDDPFGPGLGTVIGPYRLIEQVGEGGMGAVFLAEQSEPLQRKVALKVIKPGMDSRHVIARFEAERQALALMDHPNIAKVFDAGATTLGRPYFVMELIQGVPITRYCDEQRLTPKERLDLFIPVCQAVQHAHQKGIIHRDLKPSNVMITLRDGKPVPKIIDFGVAKAMGQKLTEHTLFTGHGLVVGTLAYMSPEQAEPNQNDIDTRSDIYSLGVMMYELLTGTTPLDSHRLREAAWVELLRMLREEEPPKPSTRLSTADELPSIAANRGLEPKKLSGLVRGDLDWIVMKSLEKDRARRYATANGLARDIERYLNEEPVEAGPPGVGYKLRKFARRHKAVLVTAAAFALILVLAAAVSTWQAVRATLAERATGLERDRAVKEKERADQAAAIATAVDEFLQKDLLDQADIANQSSRAERNPNITVRELLDRAAQKIDGNFRGQPRTEAAIRLTVGQAYLGLGEFSEAQKHLDRSLAWRRETLGADHPETLDTASELARLNYWRGQFGEAEALFKDVLARRKTALGDDHAATLSTVNQLAALYWVRGRFDEAESLFQLALNRLSATDPTSTQTLVTGNNLATLYQTRGRYDEAEKLYNQVLEKSREQLGNDHPHTFQILTNLGTLHWARRRYDRAEAILRELLESRRAKQGAEHSDTARTMVSLATVYSDQGKFDEAESLFRRALEIQRLKLPLNHPHILDALSGLAAFYRNRGRQDEAEPLFKELVAARRVVLPAHHPDLLVALNNLAALHSDLGRFDEAVRLQLEVVAGARATLGVNHNWTQLWINSLAFYHGRQGQPQRAEPLLRELIPILHEQAGLESTRYAALLAQLAENLLVQKKYDEAESLARQSLAFRHKKEPDAWATFHTQSVLGGALLGQKKHADAEPLLTQGYEGMKKREDKISKSVKFRLTAALERIIQLYDDWGKPAEAEKWRKLLPPPAKP